jgi:nitronate monooxygenase
VAEIRQYLLDEKLDIPLIPAGGIFTGGDAATFSRKRRFRGAGGDALHRSQGVRTAGSTSSRKYFEANEDGIEVNMISPTGYPMRMLSSSPAIGDGIRPNCEAYGYLLDANGNCSYITSYNREVAAHPGAKRVSVMDKTCLCTQMRNFELLDLRALHLSPQGHQPEAGRRHVSAAHCRAYLQGLPVQHRPAR